MKANQQRYTNQGRFIVTGLVALFLLMYTLVAARGYQAAPTAKAFRPDTLIDVKYLMGKYNAATDIVFAEVDSTYAVRPGIFIREETYGAFINMWNAARRDGVHLMVVSGVRSFAQQKQLWESKWYGRMKVDGINAATTYKDPLERARFILKYTAMPGSSRHHWGTDIDMNGTEPEYWESAKGKKTYAWLCENAPRYGFVQPYTAKGAERPVGFDEEPWHWSHVHISRYYMETWRQHVQYADIFGFAGAETAEALHIIEDYVLGVNPVCK